MGLCNLLSLHRQTFSNNLFYVRFVAREAWISLQHDDQLMLLTSWAWKCMAATFIKLSQTPNLFLFLQCRRKTQTKIKLCQRKPSSTSYYFLLLTAPASSRDIFNTGLLSHSFEESFVSCLPQSFVTSSLSVDNSPISDSTRNLGCSWRKAVKQTVWETLAKVRNQ